MNKVREFCFFLLFIFLGNSLFAENIIGQNEILFGGTLLSYTATNVPPGHFAFEQFVFLTNTYGQYDKSSKLKENISFNQCELVPYFKFGIQKIVDVNVITTVVSSHAKGRNSISFGDTLFLLGFQLLKAQKDSWVPDARLLIGESFPTGKYDRLRKNMNGGDGIGSGAFETVFLLSFAKVFSVTQKHAFRFNPNLYYFISSHVKISDFSVYGGGDGTNGIVKPGAQIAFDFPFEFNITNHLIFGMDVFYIHKNKTPFDPKTANSPLAGLPSSENFSLTPCLEYNPSMNFGVEGGAWFTVSGRNSLAFASAVFVIWWYF